MTALFLTAPAVSAQSAARDGTFRGIGLAEGMELKLSTLDGIVQGTFTESNGAQSVVRLRQTDPGNAIGTVRVQGVPVFMLLEFREDGNVGLGTVPLNSAGQPITGAAQGFDFVPERVGRF
ncbi:hypothetical protein FHS89_002599 [Rubricella aquisinus]|uniref:Uncharacterized protein n=1 Tax=Rubricella aquisinus TaxID=2028108 RepID=A0A840WNC3_9RHOB|nr:hypothetical protein [Rubricella aquisinus]MBB5516568.1 hypothetical protein [Rubricella aquisinus]